MTSFFSRLFGKAATSDTEASVAPEAIEYEGYSIRATPQRAGDQWRLAGVIIKSSACGDLRREFIRADTFASRDDAEQFAIRKGKQIVDEQGSRLFADGAATGPA